MFSGLIADLGKVDSITGGEEGSRIRLRTSLAGEVALGDSVAVNGCCLTATATGPDWFEADAMNQTLTLTSLGSLEAGSPVNLELALRADQRLGGHIVQGHVDGVGEVVSQVEDGFAVRLTVTLPEGLSRYVVPQGSITIEGVSLTVSDCAPGRVEVSLIPETRERTNLGGLSDGQPVNVECDVIAKYVEKMVSPYVGTVSPPQNPTENERSK